MSLRKRISSARERSAQAREKRHEERRRAELAKQTATGSQRAKARPEAKAKPKPKTVAADARKLGGGVASVGSELFKLGREMVAIPVQLWLAAAEVAGAFVLKAWQRGLRPVLAWLYRFGRSALDLAERQLTPARAVAAVSLVAIGALAASQWLDYHSVSVGTDAYSGTVGAVAPAPEVETEIAGNAHAWVMLPLAVAALVALTVALSGRRRAGLLLVPIGVAAIAVALAVDLSKGLDEGTAAVAYEGAEASLLEGFWVQIAAAVVLIACGLLLPRYLRPVSAKSASEATPTGPTLFEQIATRAKKAAARRPATKLKLPRPRSKRKVQGARP